MDKKSSIKKIAIFTMIFIMCTVSLSPVLAKSDSENPTYNNTDYNLTASDPIWPEIFANNKTNDQSQYLGPQNNTTKWIFEVEGSDGIVGQTIGEDGTIYFTSTNYDNNNTTLFALNPNGTQKWNATLENSYALSPSIGPNGLLYLMGYIMGDYEDIPIMYAVNPDGTLRWQYIFNEFESEVASYQVVGKDGTIYIGLNVYNDENDFARICAINPNGTIKWNYDIKNGLDDVIYTLFNSVGSDGTLYVGSYFEGDDEDLHGVLNAINPDGTLKWNYTFTENVAKKLFYSASIGTSVAPDGTIYAAISSVVDENVQINLYAFNPTGTVKWVQNINDGIFNFVVSIPSIASNGNIYFSTVFGDDVEGDLLSKLHAFSSDGTKLWNYTSASTVAEFCSQVVGTDGTIYLASVGNPLIALNPDGTEKWKYNYTVWGIPSITKDGTLYVGVWDFETNAALHAIKGQQSSLYVETSVDKKNPKVGETVKITFKVGNNGPDTAYRTLMTFTLPKGMQFIKAMVDSGFFTYNATTRTITWNLGNLGVTDPYLYVWVKFLAAGGYKIQPVLSTLTYDPDLANNTQSIVVNAQKQSSSTVGMQKTGLPIAAVLLALLMVFGGIVGSKKRK